MSFYSAIKNLKNAIVARPPTEYMIKASQNDLCGQHMTIMHAFVILFIASSARVDITGSVHHIVTWQQVIVVIQFL